MAVDASQVLQQSKTFVLGLTPRQRILIILSIVAVVGTLWVLVSLMGRGDYTTLYSGLDPAEANTIVKRLAEENIPSELSADGKTLSVPQSRLDKARLDMAAEGLPQTGRLGFEMFDKSNWGESDFAEQVNYQRALEGELERTIQDLTDVEAVRVHLVLPHESLFTEQERQAKASVLVKLRNGQLSERSLKAITYLVASAVDTLQPSNVTVIDADGNVPIIMRGGITPGSPEGAAEYEQALDQKLEATLAPVIGAGHFVARATVEYDQASVDNTQEIFDPKDSVVLTSQVTSDGSGDDGSDTGIPGAASNVPQDQSTNANSPANAAKSQNSNNAPTTATTSSQNSSSQDDNSGTDDEGDETSDSKTYGVGRTVVHTVRPPGAIRRITAAILVDDKAETKVVNKKETTVQVARTPDELKQIQALATAVLGLDSSRGDLVTVENIPFQITPIPPATPLTALKQVGTLLNQYGYILRYIILGLLGVLVLLFVLKPLVGQLGSLPRALPEARPAALGASAGGVEMTLGGAAPALAGAPTSPEEIAGLPPERQKFVRLKESVTAKVARNPADAGRLIQGWLQEEEEE